MSHRNVSEGGKKDKGNFFVVRPMARLRRDVDKGFANAVGDPILM